MYYLSQANEGKNVLSDVTYFINSLKEKLDAFNEAKSKLSKTQKKVWINKETKELVYEEPKRTDKDGNEVENLKEYWWVSPASTKLMAYIEAEIAFGEAVSNIIKTNNEVAPGRAEQIKEDEALREVIDLTEGLKEKTKPSEGDVDEIVVKKKTKPETKPDEQVDEEIDYSNPDEFVLPKFMYPFQKWIQSISAGVLVVTIDGNVKTGITNKITVSISYSIPLTLIHI